MRPYRCVTARLLVSALLPVGVACGGHAPTGADGASAAPWTTASEEPAATDACAAYPPPFEASYLPDGFDHELREGAGLFKGADYPTEGLLGHYRGEPETVHVNFEVRGGPLPYEPARSSPVTVLGSRGKIGSIEGGFAVEFSLDDCDFRMDAYGVTRRETVKVAEGLRRRS